MELQRKNIRQAATITLGVIVFFLFLLGLDYMPKTRDLSLLVSFLLAPWVILFYLFYYVIALINVFRKKFNLQNLLPTTILSVGILVVIGFYIASEHFKLNLDKRKLLIEQIKTDRLKVTDGKVVLLPAEYEELSIGKWVRVEKFKDNTFTVEFYYESLPGDNFTTLHYTNNSEKIKEFERYIKEYDNYCKKVEAEWYFLFH